MKTFGLTLSGGGVRALAHAGMLKALEEHNLRPMVISGTSGGALVGALYASGKTPEKIIDFFKETPLFKLSMLSLPRMGLINSNTLLYSKNTFLAIPLRNSPSHYT